MRDQSFALVLLVLVMTAGCATTRNPPVVDYGASPPAVAALYQTETRHSDKSAAATRSPWRLWREADRQVREYPQNQTAEHWQRDGATVFHSKYFHADRRGIEFQQDDLTMVGALPSWQQIALLVSPQVLAALPVKSSGTRRGYPWVRHAGLHNGIEWDITLRTDLMLPVRVLRKQGSEVEQLTLVSAVPLAEADWRPVAIEGYGMLDFADLGDNERDPFVLRVQNHLEVGHAH